MKNILFILFLTFSFFVKAQKTQNDQFFRKGVVPFSLLGIGLLLNHSELEQHIQKKVNPHFNLPIDDYLPFVPVSQIYLGDLLKLKAKNHWFDQSKYLFLSTALSTSVAVGIKRLFPKARPNHDKFSFPSGHTTVSFSTASVLMKEYQGTYPLYAYSGYIFATSTATLRILHNKHWLSDVFFGAGLGIISTEIIYYLKPLQSFNPFLNNNSITFLPQVNTNGFGFYFKYKL